MRRKWLIGCSEYVEFPDWKVPFVKARIDTGARTSALHVENFRQLASGRVRFDVVHGTRSQPQFKRVTTWPTRWSRVRSSNGHFQMRCFVATGVRIGPVEKTIEISLVSRDMMQFRMLLGRSAMIHDFQVDPGRRTLLTARPRRRGGG